MRRILALVCCFAFPLAVRGEVAPAPWPQFRGPDGSGLAENSHPPTEIGPDKNVKWKVTAPAGASSPIVVGELLVLTAFDQDKLFTIAYRRGDGGEAWRMEAPHAQLETYHKTEGSPAASSCATDGERIVSYFGSCGLFCYDLAGKELWRREMPPAKTPGDFGTGVSPIIADGVVVLLRDEATAPKIVALDVKTGEPRWEKPRTSVSGFGTPAVWKTAEGVQIAAPGYGKMIGYDLASGAEKWFVEGMPSACCTTPVIGDGVLLFAGWCPGDSTDPEGMKMPTYDEILAKSDKNKDGVYEKSEADAQGAAFFDNQDMNKDGKIERKEWDGLLSFLANSVNSAFALSAGGSGDVGKTHLKWRQKEGLPYVPSAIFCQGQYVMVKDGGIVTAYNAADGKRLYRERAVASGGYYASPIAAGGNIYFTTLADGAVTVLKAGAAKPEVVAKNPPLGERVSATPAVADDTLYIRTAGHLYAFAK